MSDFQIPEGEQQNVLDLLWTLLIQTENTINPKIDILARHDVESAYTVLNRIGFTKLQPRWKKWNF